MWGREETDWETMGDSEGGRQSQRARDAATSPARVKLLKKKSPSVPTANECREAPRKRPPPGPPKLLLQLEEGFTSGAGGSCELHRLCLIFALLFLPRQNLNLKIYLSLKNENKTQNLYLLSFLTLFFF